MTDAPTPEQATAFVHAAVPAIGRLGIVVEGIAPGEARLRLPLEPNRNHIGTMYAGALVALAELPGGLLPLGMPELAVVPIVVDLTVNFRRAVRSDAFLEVSIAPDELRRLAEFAHAEGRADFVLDTEVHDAEGRVVMTSRAAYQLRPAVAGGSR